MKINGEDIAKYEARQLNITIGNCEVSNESQWAEGSLLPLLQENTVGMKELKVVLVVKGKDREEIIWNKSRILSKLLEPAEIYLDHFSHFFRVILQKHSTEEVSMRRFHTLTLEFEGYEHGRGETAEFTGTSYRLKNPGSLKSPCSVTVTTQTAVESLTLTGFGEDIEIKNLKANQPVILDGINGLVTENGGSKIDDVELSQLPFLKSGQNVITVSQEVTVEINYQPIYM